MCYFEISEHHLAGFRNFGPRATKTENSSLCSALHCNWCSCFHLDVPAGNLKSLFFLIFQATSLLQNLVYYFLFSFQ